MRGILGAVVPSTTALSMANCDKDEDLYWKCSDEETVCHGNCADAKASTKVTTDFDIDIEGAFVEEA